MPLIIISSLHKTVLIDLHRLGYIFMCGNQHEPVPNSYVHLGTSCL